MAGQRYSAIDMYHTVVAIEKLVDDLVCKGLHDDQGESYYALKTFVQTERETLVFRAARTEAELRRRQRIQTKEITSGDHS